MCSVAPTPTPFYYTWRQSKRQTRILNMSTHNATEEERRWLSGGKKEEADYEGRERQRKKKKGVGEEAEKPKGPALSLRSVRRYDSVTSPLPPSLSFSKTGAGLLLTPRPREQIVTRQSKCYHTISAQRRTTITTKEQDTNPPRISFPPLLRSHTRSFPQGLS